MFFYKSTLKCIKYTVEYTDFNLYSSVHFYICVHLCSVPLCCIHLCLHASYVNYRTFLGLPLCHAPIHTSPYSLTEVTTALTSNTIK